MENVKKELLLELLEDAESKLITKAEKEALMTLFRYADNQNYCFLKSSYKYNKFSMALQSLYTKIVGQKFKTERDNDHSHISDELFNIL